MKKWKFSVFTVSILCCLAFFPPKKKFIDPANIDVSVKPGDNFFLYANGVWLKNNPVPASKTRWGSFDELREQSSQRVKGLLDAAAAKSSSDSSMQKIGDFYTSGMDSLTLEKSGYQPIKKDFDRIAEIKDINGILNEVAYQHVNGISNTLFSFSVDQDAKNVMRYIPQFSQGGSTLPDRDYYIKNDSRSTTVRNAYITHIQRSFELTGVDSNTARYYSDAVMRIETALAKSQFPRVDLRDPYKTYNIIAVEDFSTMTPVIEWKAMLKKLKIDKPVDSIVLNNREFFKTEDILLAALPVKDWKAYLAWNLLRNAQPLLSAAFVNEDFSFARILSGQKQQTPRWQRMSGLIDEELGDQVGKLYVSKYFKPAAKQRMQEMVNNLQQTFGSRIRQLDWMGAETKIKALEKLNAFTKKIAYPDKWQDYSGVVIASNNLVENVRSTSQWKYRKMVDRFGKPVDKSIWAMTPPTINAYYNPANNEIVFPAGILQFPFFDFDADDAVNYGGIAAVIGHEMTHGFDDQGRQYGADGNLRDWWTGQDAANFKKRTDEVVNQYDLMTVQDSIHINGKLTLGENLADFGGLAMAYEAFTHTKQFKENKKLDGFTPVQRFFLSWAQVWRSNILPEMEAQYILVDPHSPAKYRANVPPSNMDQWYEAFNVKQGDKMFRPADKRVKVW